CSLRSNRVGMAAPGRPRGAAPVRIRPFGGPMLISPAFAQAAGDGASSYGSLLMFLPILVVFYFFLIRPQQQRAKQQKQMLEGLRRGDKIVTSGGIIGTIAKVVS